jgi:penicillin-binding protein 2
MKFRRLAILGCAVLLITAACAGAPQVGVTPPSPTDLPSAEQTAAPTSIPLPGAATTASQFIDAINAQDYASAFALLDADSQAEMEDAAGLKAIYDNIKLTTVVSQTTAALRGGLLQAGDTVSATIVSQWPSALVGPFTFTGTLTLAYDPSTTNWRVKWSRDAIANGLAEGRLQMDRLPLVRGNIIAADGAVLAQENQLTVIGVQRGAVGDEEVEREMLQLLSEITQLAPDEIKAKYADQPATWFTPIADVDEDLLTQYSSRLEQFPAISAQYRYTRNYLQPDLAPHVIGFTGFIPPERLEEFKAQGFEGDERIGLVGVEAGANTLLGGIPGGELTLIAPGSRTVVARRDGARGQDVTLTLMPNFQTQVQQLLGNRKGAAVVLRASDSAVLAMASAPVFSPTNVTNEAIQEGALLNRATQGQYPPGSTFKMVTMVAGMNDGVTQAGDVFIDPGYWEGYGTDFRKTCWLKSGHGRITLENGLTASCNIVFYEVGKRLEDQSSFLLPEAARAFGFGSRTGVELPEAAGIVPDPEWKLKAIGEAWRGGDTVNMAVGQGYMLATPLQVAQYTAAIANNGVLRPPFLVAQPRDPSKQAETRVPVSPEGLKAIQDAMVGVTTNARYGTTTYRFATFNYYFDASGNVVPASQIPARERNTSRRLVVAGKSGTAQAAGEDSKPFAWFTAYVPADQPEIVVTAMLENIGEGSSYAAPLVRQIIEAYYGLPISATPTDRKDNE